MNSYGKLIEGSLDRLIKKFREKPHDFFNEHDLHCYFYHVCYQNKKFFIRLNKEGKKKEFFLLHPEYPTINRFDREKVEKKDYNDTRSGRKRAKYDFAILKEDFINKSFVSGDLEILKNKDINKITEENKSDRLHAVIEFKLVISSSTIGRHDQYYIKELLFDLFKLSVAKEAEKKYMFIFFDMDQDYFENVKVSEKNKRKWKKILKKIENEKTKITIRYFTKDNEQPNKKQNFLELIKGVLK